MRLAGMWKSAVALAAAGLLSACVAQFRDHGYIPSTQARASLAVGQDTMETIAERVGTPTTGGVIRGQSYYYVASRFRHYGLLEPEEVQRQVLVLDFDSAGILRNIELLALEDGRVVELERRVTDDNLSDVSFLAQLVGGIGRFEASDFVGSE
ncbi:outer membrane protein assembly factor BamE domain-containing protein [Pseudoroseicyclus tamaricis]|uniref:Outer membrane protein assembly factor BamE n=1 Tax=Pseudoroseicyclus tamaricis TaxID=2705421 RepID=A0A6B2JSK8_9RHOB|nr:outer membrane protein assembly factor BamE [Pseudoroseicyclus tamaricis]NDV01547.1 outer membrane protein assembly factor BamE [Pseudoroseicyclus tamaricis]